MRCLRSFNIKKKHLYILRMHNIEAISREVPLVRLLAKWAFCSVQLLLTFIYRSSLWLEIDLGQWQSSMQPIYAAVFPGAAGTMNGPRYLSPFLLTINRNGVALFESQNYYWKGTTTRVTPLLSALVSFWEETGMWPCRPVAIIKSDEKI